MDFIDLVNNLNNRLDALHMETSKFQLDRIICSHPLKTTILGHSNSIKNDQAIVPNDLRIPILSNIHNLKTVIWINKKYEDILIALQNGKKYDYQTLLVRLRIAACMVTSNNIKGLTNEEKEEWRQHIVKTFYERNLVIMNYYLEEIEKIPFQIIVIGFTAIYQF